MAVRLEVTRQSVRKWEADTEKEKDKEPLIDIGKAYFKEAETGDIVTNPETGIIYVKNQILISVLPADNKNVFEDMVTTNDARYAEEEWNEAVPDGANWGLEALKIPSAWKGYKDFQPVKVGIIDDMFDTKHEDLKFEQTFHNDFDILNKEHGTHVAGIMAGLFNNQLGISGVITDAKLYGYAFKTEVNNMTTAMKYKYAFAILVGNQVKVINVSQNTGHVQCFAASRGNQNAINYVKTNAEILGSFLNKLILQGYDFVIVSSAGNIESKKFCMDGTSPYGYKIWEEKKTQGHP